MQIQKAILCALNIINIINVCDSSIKYIFSCVQVNLSPICIQHFYQNAYGLDIILYSEDFMLVWAAKQYTEEEINDSTINQECIIKWFDNFVCEMAKDFNQSYFSKSKGLEDVYKTIKDFVKNTTNFADAKQLTGHEILEPLLAKSPHNHKMTSYFRCVEISGEDSKLLSDYMMKNAISAKIIKDDTILLVIFGDSERIIVELESRVSKIETVEGKSCTLDRIKITKESLQKSNFIEIVENPWNTLSKPTNNFNCLRVGEATSACLKCLMQSVKKQERSLIWTEGISLTNGIRINAQNVYLLLMNYYNEPRSTLYDREHFSECISNELCRSIDHVKEMTCETAIHSVEKPDLKNGYLKTSENNGQPFTLSGIPLKGVSSQKIVTCLRSLARNHSGVFGWRKKDTYYLVFPDEVRVFLLSLSYTYFKPCVLLMVDHEITLIKVGNQS